MHTFFVFPVKVFFFILIEDLRIDGVIIEFEQFLIIV